MVKLWLFIVCVRDLGSHGRCSIVVSIPRQQRFLIFIYIYTHLGRISQPIWYSRLFRFLYIIILLFLYAFIIIIFEKVIQAIFVAKIHGDFNAVHHSCHKTKNLKYPKEENVLYASFLWSKFYNLLCCFCFLSFIFHNCYNLWTIVVKLNKWIEKTNHMYQWHKCCFLLRKLHSITIF